MFYGNFDLFGEFLQLQVKLHELSELLDKIYFIWFADWIGRIKTAINRKEALYYRLDSATLIQEAQRLELAEHVVCILIILFQFNLIVCFFEFVLFLPHKVIL